MSVPKSRMSLPPAYERDERRLHGQGRLELFADDVAQPFAADGQIGVLPPRLRFGQLLGDPVRPAPHAVREPGIVVPDALGEGIPEGNKDPPPVRARGVRHFSDHPSTVASPPGHQGTSGLTVGGFTGGSGNETGQGSGLCKDGLAGKSEPCSWNLGRNVGTGEVSMGIATMTAATVSGVAVLACYAAAPLPALPAQFRLATD